MILQQMIFIIVMICCRKTKPASLYLFRPRNLKQWPTFGPPIPVDVNTTTDGTSTNSYSSSASESDEVFPTWAIYMIVVPGSLLILIVIVYCMVKFVGCARSERTEQSSKEQKGIRRSPVASKTPLPTESDYSSLGLIPSKIPDTKANKKLVKRDGDFTMDEAETGTSSSFVTVPVETLKHLGHQISTPAPAPLVPSPSSSTTVKASSTAEDSESKKQQRRFSETMETWESTSSPTAIRRPI